MPKVPRHPNFSPVLRRLVLAEGRRAAAWPVFCFWIGSAAELGADSPLQLTLPAGDQRYSSTELKLQPSSDSSPSLTISFFKHLSQRLHIPGTAQATQLPEPPVICPPQVESEPLDNFFWGPNRPTAEDMEAFKLFNQVVFYPRSREIADIIYRNIHLLATDKHEDYHYLLITRYCAQVLGNSVVFHLWGKEDAGQAHPFGDSFPRDLDLFLFPAEFVTYFQDKRQELRAQYLQLLRVRTQGGRGANIRLQTWEEYMTRLRRQQAASALARSPEAQRQTSSTTEAHLTNVSAD